LRGAHPHNLPHPARRPHSAPPEPVPPVARFLPISSGRLLSDSHQLPRLRAAHQCFGQPQQAAAVTLHLRSQTHSRSPAPYLTFPLEARGPHELRPTKPVAGVTLTARHHRRMALKPLQAAASRACLPSDGLQHLTKGHGVCLIDPHHDLSFDTLSYLRYPFVPRCYRTARKGEASPTKLLRSARWNGQPAFGVAALGVHGSTPALPDRLGDKLVAIFGTYFGRLLEGRIQ
jgi:hypothetical protein